MKKIVLKNLTEKMIKVSISYNIYINDWKHYLH